jgi:hypothetical protein
MNMKGGWKWPPFSMRGIDLQMDGSAIDDVGAVEGDDVQPGCPRKFWSFVHDGNSRRSNVTGPLAMMACEFNRFK